MYVPTICITHSGLDDKGWGGEEREDYQMMSTFEIEATKLVLYEYLQINKQKFDYTYRP